MYSDAVISYDEHMNWYNRIKNSEETIVKVLYYLNKPIGFVNLTKIDKVNRTCYWGFYIGDERAPKGSGTIMGYLALEYIFETLAARKVCAEILGYNNVSISYHKKLGFVEEGCLRKHVYKQGELTDVRLMAHFAEHWKLIKETLREGIRRYERR